MSELSESEFKSIVDAVAADDSRVVSVVTNGFSVGMEILSRSRKQRWSGSFHFDPQTLEASYRSDYPNASVVWGFANEVRRRITGE